MISVDEIRGFDRSVGIGQADTSKSSRAGLNDGKAEVPAADSNDLQGFEKTLVSDFLASVQNLSRSCKSKVSNLNRTIEKTRYEIDEDIPKQIEIVSTDNKAELDSIERQFGPRSAAYESANNQYEESKKAHQTVADLLKRPLQIHFAGVYLPFMLALAFAEVWVNRLAFELFFESNPMVSIALSIAVGAVLIFFAHISGGIAKQAQCEEITPPKVKMYWSLAGLNLIVFFLAMFLAKMRQALITINEQSTASLGSLLEDDIFGDGALDSLAGVAEPSMLDIFSMGSMGEEGVFLLMINLVIYICGFLAAFYRHDSHPDYEKLTHNMEKRRVALEVIRSRYESRSEEISRKFRTKFSYLEESGRSKESQVKDIEHQIAEVQRTLETKIEEGIHAVAKQLAAYRAANVKARSTNAPSYFSKDPEEILSEYLKAKGFE